MKITTRVTWKRREGGGVKREWEGKQLVPSPSPVQPNRFLIGTHTAVLVAEHISRTTKGRTDGGRGLTAARTQYHQPVPVTSLNKLPSPRLLGKEASVRLEVTATEALIARVGKPE